MVKLYEITVLYIAIHVHAHITDTHHKLHQSKYRSLRKYIFVYIEEVFILKNHQRIIYPRHQSNKSIFHNVLPRPVFLIWCSYSTMNLGLSYENLPINSRLKI